MIKVILVFPTALGRKALSDAINSDPQMEVVGTASDIESALSKIRYLKPDAVAADAGSLCCKPGGCDHFMSSQNIPLLLVSGSKMPCPQAQKALLGGLTDFIDIDAYATVADDRQPDTDGADDMDGRGIFSGAFQKELVARIKALGKARLTKRHSPAPVIRHFSPTRKKIIVIATSAGGPQTLEALLLQLPASIPVPILVVQHMPPGFTKSLAERLNKICEVEVKEACDGEELKPGAVFIAPGGFHMELKSEMEGYEGVIRLNTLPPELGVRPCANRLFKSVADIFKENTIGVILTGMGTDGTEGAKAIKEKQGTIIVESEKTSIIYGMPKSAIEAGLADEIVDLEKMGVAILQLMEI